MKTLPDTRIVCHLSAAHEPSTIDSAALTPEENKAPGCRKDYLRVIFYFKIKYLHYNEQNHQQNRNKMPLEFDHPVLIKSDPSSIIYRYLDLEKFLSPQGLSQSTLRHVHAFPPVHRAITEIPYF